MINTKSKKAEVKDFINSVIKDKELLAKLGTEVKSMLTYTVKAYKNDPDTVTLKDLRELALDIQNCLVVADAKEKEVVAEEKVAPTKKTIKKSVKAEEVKEEEAPTQTEEVKKTQTKKGLKKSAPKKAEETLAENPKVTKKPAKVEEKPKVKSPIFPAKIDTELGTAFIVKDEIDSVESFSSAVNADRQFIVAMKWYADDIKAGSYDPLECGDVPKKFEKDIDVSQPVYFNENNKAFYTVSLVTEVMRAFVAEDLKLTDENGLRDSNSLEWAIYEIK